MDFDKFSGSYEQDIAESTGFTGQTPDFYRRIKVDHIREILRRRFESLENLRVLDVGCGVGLTDELLKAELPILAGVDVSSRSLDEARCRNPELSYNWSDGKTLPYPDRSFDMLFAICVWHHVPPEGWDNFVQEMLRVLVPSGILLVFEHNPWNPFTRAAVSRCAFDCDATLLSAPMAKRKLIRAGFRHESTDFILFTPLESQFLRRIERRILRKIPIGAQYALLGSKV